jgi:hypothetical protein
MARPGAPGKARGVTMALPVSSFPTPPGVASAAAPLIPFSCMTGASKEVLRHIQQSALSAKAKYFLTMIAIASFGNAGWQKQQHLPDPGVSCRFALSAWAREHGWSRQSTWRIREQMVALGILFYEPDPVHPQEGLLRWNLDFSQWQVLEDSYRRQRYTRRGAGRPQQTEETEMSKSNGLQQAESSNVRSTKSAVEGEPPTTKSNWLQTTGKSNGLQKKSNWLQTTDSPEIKLVTPALVETAQEVVPEGTVRKALRKKAKNTALSDDSADAPCASPQGGIVLLNLVENTGSSAATAASLASFGASERSSSWPPRQEWEQTDLDYYQRVLREREKERVALLVRLAHERLGVPLETASYARIGALAKQAGAALLVKHILLAAANHIDGDPLAYLTKLVHSQQAGHARKKEASNGWALTHSSNNSDIPRRSSWDGWDVATAR